LPKKLLEEAPVGPGGSSSGEGSSSGFQVFGRPGGNSKKDDGASSTAVFSGSGHTLTTDKSSRWSLRGSSSNKKGDDSLTDRREKARMAALARMSGQGDSDTEA